MKRNFVVLDENNRDTHHLFRGLYPCRVARKLASRGYTDIRLRETKTKKVHVFEGWRTEKDNSQSTLDWVRKIKFTGKAKKLYTQKL